MPEKTSSHHEVRFRRMSLNILDRGQRQMIGILYLTSLNRKYSGPDTLAFKALADYLGMVLAVIGNHEPPKKSGANNK